MIPLFRTIRPATFKWALLASLTACVPLSGDGGVRALNVPASVEQLAVAPPSRPLAPSGPAPAVRTVRPARAAAPTTPAVADDPDASAPAEEGEATALGGEGTDETVEADDSPMSRAVAVARGVSAERTLDRIIGATEDEVRLRIGPPVMITPRPPGIQWNYRQADCTLQVYFFMEIATRDFRVLSYDLTGDDVDARRECASRFAGRQQGSAVTGAAG